jgi:YegS/Rv2252/BmrU family lipid kinase
MDEELWVEELPIFGVIPIGSGNDFARSLGDSINPEALVKLLAERKTNGIDVGKITFLEKAEQRKVYFINEADIGMGPDVVRKVMNSKKPFGSAVAYYFSILATFISYKPFRVTTQTNQWKWSGKIRTLAIANGKYFGNGLGIAPDAETNDGKFSTFIVEDVSVLDFIWFSNTLKQCKKVIHKKVHYNETQSIELRSEAHVVIEADGEAVGNLPVRIDLLPQRIRLLM